MANYRWRDDERGWDENRQGRSGSSSGGWGSYADYERRGRDEDYGRQFGQDEYRQRHQQGRGGYDYEREHSGVGYGGPSWESASSGYGNDPYGSSQYGRGSQGRGGQYGQDWRGRQGMGGDMGREWRGQGYRGYEGSYGGAYGGDWDQERGWWDRTRDEMRSWMGDDEAERRRRMDDMRQRSHYGRGPRGFTRTDDRIREDVCERLTYDWSVDASDMEVNVSKGEVTLTGSVESRHSKRRAEDLVEDVPGVRHVQNNLRVKEATTGTTGATGTSTGTAARPTH